MTGPEWERVVGSFLAALPQVVAFQTPPAVRHVGRRLVQVADGPPDFLGLVDGRGLAIECKLTEDARWRFDHLRPHQAGALDAWHRQGGVAILALATEGGKRRQLVPWRWVSPLWHAHHDTPGRAAAGRASLSADDLLRLGRPLDQFFAVVNSCCSSC